MVMQHLSEFFVTSASAALSKSDEPEQVSQLCLATLHDGVSVTARQSSTFSALVAVYAMLRHDVPARCIVQLKTLILHQSVCKTTCCVVIATSPWTKSTHPAQL